MDSCGFSLGFHAAASLCASAPMHLAAAPTAFGFLPEVLQGMSVDALWMLQVRSKVQMMQLGTSSEAY